MSKERVERRLAAILAADVAGYSRLMGADEEGTLRRLRAHRREVVDPKIREHRGRIVKTTGDGMLVEFASVVDGVRCAVEVQRTMIERELDLADDQRISFRIGINLGDIIVEAEDIFGDGVNVAARLEGLAEPGGVCIAGGVMEQIDGKLPYAFHDIGMQVLKNIARPVHAHLLDAAAVATTALVPVKPRRPPAPRHPGKTISRRTDSQRAPRLSIVVLPFTNLSNDPEQEYFADAITDDVTTDLSRIVDSFVIARTTAFTYKGRAIEVKQIGRELGVQHVLEGSVRRRGEQVEVNVQLIDAETGAHLWADRFDTDRANLASAERDITGRLARTLQVELVIAVGRKIERETPNNLDARDLVMRAWAAWFKPRTPATLQESLQLFQRALELDPQSADARVGIARVLTEKRAYGTVDLARAEQLLGEALEQDRFNPRLQVAIGVLCRIQGRFVEAKMALEEAIALDRNNAEGMMHLGWTLVALAQPNAALPYFEQAIRLTPRLQNIHFYLYGLGACHLHLGNFDAAIDLLRRAYASNAHFFQIPLNLAAALALRGDIDAARAALAESLKLNPNFRSLADWRRILSGWYANPPYATLAAKVVEVGLLRAGLPEA